MSKREKSEYQSKVINDSGLTRGHQIEADKDRHKRDVGVAFDAAGTLLSL